MIQLETIIESFAAYQPRLLDLDNNRHAAVAMILRGREGFLEALFIERTRIQGDPWSGQMAFPGGMVEPEDRDAKYAAQRETLEEVGIDLSNAHYIGQMDDMQGRHRGYQKGIVVSGFVFMDTADQIPEPNYEVADIIWESLENFLDINRRTYIRYPDNSGDEFPGVKVGYAPHQIIWGLTWRFLNSFFDTLKIPT